MSLLLKFIAPLELADETKGVLANGVDIGGAVPPILHIMTYLVFAAIYAGIPLLPFNPSWHEPQDQERSAPFCFPAYISTCPLYAMMSNG